MSETFEQIVLRDTQLKIIEAETQSNTMVEFHRILNTRFGLKAYETWGYGDPLGFLLWCYAESEWLGGYRPVDCLDSSRVMVACSAAKSMVG